MIASGMNSSGVKNRLQNNVEPIKDVSPTDFREVFNLIYLN
jgi:hypothetical protein